MKVLYLCASLVFVYAQVFGQAPANVRVGEKSSECDLSSVTSLVNQLAQQLAQTRAQLENEISSLRLQLSSIAASNSATNTLANRVKNLESCISCNTGNAGICVWSLKNDLQKSITFKNDTYGCDINSWQIVTEGGAGAQ